jgi:type VI secretion system secreted protein Hcp
LLSWGIMQPKSATASTGGGHTAERAELTDISFTKQSDLSSPILMQTCASGKTLPRAKLEFMRADGQGQSIKYFEIELENVLIGHIEPSIRPGDILSEIVGLKFSKVNGSTPSKRSAAEAAATRLAAGTWLRTESPNHVLTTRRNTL